MGSVTSFYTACVLLEKYNIICVFVKMHFRNVQNQFLIVENDHSKLRILVYSRLENQRLWPLVVTATIDLSGPKQSFTI